MPSAWNTSFDEAWGESWGPVSGAGSDPGTPITNSNATNSVPVNYQICDRTGFRLMADKNLVKDGYGSMVRSASRDPEHPQDRMRSRTESQRGSASPEFDDTFISTAVTPDDL